MSTKKRPSVIVTEHALRRWRIRIATYGDEGPDKVRQAFARSRPLADSEGSGLFDGQRIRYFVDPLTGAVFVTRKEERRVYIVTVKTLEMISQPPAGRRHRP